MNQHDHPSNIPLLTCALLAALTTGGPVYAFGLYGGDLKESLQLTQSQLDTISSANFCAGLLTWIPGLFVDRYGVRLALVLGGALGAGFMMAYWAVARQYLYLDHEWILPALCGLGILIFMANGLVIGSIYKIIVSTCAPHTKGSIVGAAKGYVGLGSGVYACLFRAVKTPLISDLDFLPLAAILAVLAGSLPALLLLPGKHRMDEIVHLTPRLQLDQTTVFHLRMVYLGLIALATLVVGTTVASLLEEDRHHLPKKSSVVLEEPEEFTHYSRHYLRAILILLAWIGPLVAFLLIRAKPAALHEDYDTVDIMAEEDSSEEGNYDEFVEPNHEAKGLLKEPPSLALAYGAEITATVLATGPSGILGEKALTVSMRQQVPNLTLMQLLQSPSSWVFLGVAVIRVGGGTMMTNNMAQMVESLRLPHRTTTPAALALFSVAQAVSRVLTGAVSDSALSWKTQQALTWGGAQYKLKGVPRPAFLIVASLAGVVAHIFLSCATARNVFLMGVCLSGAAFGMIWPLMVLIVGEVFGTASMGANYMFYDGVSSALGTLLLSKFVTQEVYESQIASEGGRTCFGQQCFFGAHIIVAILSLCCAVASYWFYCSTRHVYAKRC